MHLIFRPAAVLTFALATFCLSPLGQTVLAQTQKQQAPAARQIAVTEKQVVALLAAQKDLDGFVAAAGSNAAVLAQVNNVAKKHGFADYTDYTIVLDNIGFVMAGIDATTKTYVGPAAVIKQKIAAVQADNALSAEDRKEAMGELNSRMSKSLPLVENKGNIDLVIKHYDKLAIALQDE
jgi:hypothetical protein